MQSRRRMIQASLGAAASSLVAGTNSGGAPSSSRVFSLFTKHLLGLDAQRLADTLARLGVAAIEAPIRPKGHVEPERVEDELPKFVETLKERGIVISVLASGINAVEASQHTVKVLRTAHSLGIPRFRMNWYTYDLKKPIWPQLDAIKPRLKDLVALSREIGIMPCYQNHSGKSYVGAPVWDMAMLMRDHPRESLGWCFDIMHATIEGNLSWPLELKLASDRMPVAIFKNFAWQERGTKDTPLGNGVVGKDSVDLLRASGFDGEVTLHVEYLEGQPRDEDYYRRAAEATRHDLDVLKSWWA